MKKLITILLFFTLALHSYALDFIVTPNIGFSNLSSFSQNSSDRAIHNGFCVGINVGSLSENGFTFLFGTGVVKGNYITYYDSGNKETTLLKNAFTWYNQFLFGYTFRFVDNKLHFLTSGGPCCSFGTISGIAFGATIHLELDYYFSDIVALNCSLNDSVEYVGSITNTLKLTVGPKFKL